MFAIVFWGLHPMARPMYHPVLLYPIPHHIIPLCARICHLVACVIACHLSIPCQYMPSHAVPYHPQLAIPSHTMPLHTIPYHEKTLVSCHAILCHYFQSYGILCSATARYPCCPMHCHYWHAVSCHYTSSHATPSPCYYRSSCAIKSHPMPCHALPCCGIQCHYTPSPAMPWHPIPCIVPRTIQPNAVVCLYTLTCVMLCHPIPTHTTPSHAVMCHCVPLYLILCYYTPFYAIHCIPHHAMLSQPLLPAALEGGGTTPQGGQ